MTVPRKLLVELTIGVNVALNCLTAPDFRIAALGSMVKGAFTSHSIFVSRSLKHKTTHSKNCYRKYLSLSINTSVHVFF